VSSRQALDAALDAAVRLSGDALAERGHVLRGRAARARREVLLRRLELAGRSAGLPVDLDIAVDADVGLGVHVAVRGSGPLQVRIGPGTRVEGGVSLVLAGGAQVDLGEQSDVRRGAVLNVSGTLRLTRLNKVSWGTVLHAAQRVELGERTGIAERCTIADSTHLQPSADTWFYEHWEARDVVVGADTWICPNAVVTHRARVGSYCVVAAGAVVTGVVPDGHVAVGSPATTRSRGLSWLT
jgi:acetyltransferase-like isoleucine patch superfamily enzyme